MKAQTLAKQTESSDQVIPNGLTDQNGQLELNGEKPTNGKIEPKVIDIEDAVPDAEVDKRNMDKILDKTRGFVKYKRNNQQYRNVSVRMKDWNEIYDHKGVRKELRTQAARYRISSCIIALSRPNTKLKFHT